MPRPADWSALGLSEDPTPGDPDRIDQVIAGELEYINLATTIDSGLTEVKNTSSTIFVGKTAEALRGVIDGRLRNYISTYKTAHEDVRNALIAYVAVMREQQSRADAALTAAQALAEDDESGREAQKTVAENAKSLLESASTTAEGKIDTAAESIASPVDECEEFWKALTWIALILVLPAIIFGGPIALLAIALNVALLIKTAVDFAHGNAGVTELVLAVLGVIAPTTKGLHLGNLWKVIKGLSTRGIQGGKNFFLGGANSFGLFGRVGLGIDSVFVAGGSWVRGGLQGLKLGPGLTHLPAFAKFGGRGIDVRIFPLAAELTVINMGGAMLFFGLRSIQTTVNAIKGLGSSIIHGLSGAKGLRLFLPVAADEMGRGLGLAFRIGFIDRGIFGKFRYGAFVNGEFVGLGSKIAGGVNAGMGVFTPGGDLVSLGRFDFPGTGSMNLGPMGGSFNMPSVDNPFGTGFGDFGSITVPGSLGSLNGGFNLGNFPPLGTFLSNSGNLGAVVPFGAFGAKFVDLPTLSLGSLGLTNFAGNLSVPSGFNGLGAAGLGPVPQALGHISIANLDTVSGAVAKVDVNMPASTHLVSDIPSSSAVAPANVEALHAVNLPQLGNLTTPHMTATALPQVNLPDVQTTPAANLNGSLTPAVGNTVAPVQTPTVNNIQLPAVDARLVDVPKVTTTSLTSPSTTAFGENGVVNVQGLNAISLNTHTATPETGALSGANSGDLAASSGLGSGALENSALGNVALGNLGGTGGGGNLGTAGNFAPPNAAGRNVQVFALTNVQYDFAHTFDRIPGLAGVEIRVLPGTRPGQTVDIDVQPVNVRDDVTATHLTVDGRQVLRIDQAMNDGLVHRWDYELSAQNNHRLLDDTVFDTHVGAGPGTGPGGHDSPPPSRHADLLSLTAPRPGDNDITVMMFNAQANGPAPVPPTLHTVNLPGLPGGQVQIQIGPNGALVGHQPVGGAGTPGANLTTSQFNGPMGRQFIQVDQAVVPNVETRRWTFAANNATGGQLMSTERRFQLTGGPQGGTVVSVNVNATTNMPTTVSHVNVAGGPILHPAGQAPRFHNTAIMFPAPAGGFQVYNPATGTHTADGVHLFNSNGARQGPHILMPTNGAAPTVVNADFSRTIGTVTRPANTNGQFHALFNNVGPTVRVFDNTGHFSHNSLPLQNLDGLGVPGGFIRNPHSQTPQLAALDGQVVPNSSVTPQLNNEFRVQHAGGQFHTDTTGTRLHDVVPLNGGAAGGNYVFTPPGAANPLPVPRDGGGTPSPTLTVADVNNTLHVNTGHPNNILEVYTPNGAFAHQALPLVGGGAPGGFIRLPDAANPAPLLTHADGTAVPNTTVTPQTGGSYLVQHPGGNIVVDNGGTHTHNVVRAIGLNNTPLGHYVHTPVGTPNTPNAAPTALNGTPHGTLQVTRVGADLRITNPATGSFTAHGLDGAHRFDAVRVQAGPFHGNFVRTDALGSRLTNQHLHPFPTGNVVDQVGLQGGGFRIDRGAGGHLVVGPQGTPRFDVISLRGQDGAALNQFVFTPSVHAPGALGAAAGGAPPTVHGPNGNTLGGVTIGTRPDGSFQLANPTHVGVFTPAGAFDFQALRLTDGAGAHLAQNIRVQPGGLHQLVDGQLTGVPGATIRPGHAGGFNIHTANGDIRFFNANGQLQFTATPTPAQATHLDVTNGAGVHQFTIVRLTDGSINNPVQAQFLDNTAGGLRVLDGNLNPLANTVQAQPAGGFRINGIGNQAGDFRRFDMNGRLEFQRVNVFGGNGVINNTRYFEITYPAAGNASWTMVRLNAHGTPIPVAGARNWFEGGTVDMAGSGAGRIHLVSHTGTTVFERRLLPGPGGGVLDAHHSTASLGEFGHFNQRGPWAEFNMNGNLVAHGTRHWGESTRSYFDVRTFMGKPMRVRHYQASADGGHVLATLNNMPLTQNFANSQWVRFDADFQPIASGTRNWGSGLGRGFTDHMNHPVTNAVVKVQEKFGRFQFNLHDVRRFHQIEMTPDGMPKRDFVSRHPDGNPNGFGKTLQNGDFLTNTRFAEQRPPVAFRNLFSSDLRNTDLSRLVWLRDSNMRAGTWVQENAIAGPSRGSHFIANNKATFDVASTGNIVRETRTLLNGSALTVGDVRLPTNLNTGVQATPQAHLLPWSEGGAGALQGHRSFNGPFAPAPAGAGTRTVAWQDNYTNQLADGDWFTPNAGKNWHVIRTGFTDGHYIDFRPAPQVRPDGAAGNALAPFRGTINSTSSNWTLYSPHGVVVTRSDTFPGPNPGGGHITVLGTMNPDGRTFTWNDGTNTGVRTTSFERQITPWQWDRESFQDFDGGRLIRDQRQLGDGMTVSAWRHQVNAAGHEVWHWNKVDAHGNILDFGGNGNVRIRHWFDADGNGLMRWEPGARWSDQVSTLGHRVIQEIPVAKPAAGTWRGYFSDTPFRVRDYSPTVNGTNTPFNPHVWQESDHGMITRKKFQLADGTFLETENFNKHARRYDVNGITPVNDRSISGYISEYDFNGGTSHIGRETHFTGALNEYRGNNRVFRETNRWEFGPSMAGEAVDTPFALKAIQSIGIDMSHEFLVDFAMNLVVTTIVRVLSGTLPNAMDVARAAFGAALSSINKGTIAAAHMAAGRGGWKVMFSNIDYGQPARWRPNDDSWNSEWGATERPTRWRGGLYEYGLGLGTGPIVGFVSAASQAAIFGGRAADGSIVRFTSGGAAMTGLAGVVGGMLNGISAGALRTLIQHSIGSRWIHRQGPADIFVVGSVGKLGEKLFTTLVLQPAIAKWFGLQRDTFILPPTTVSGEL